MSGFACVKLKSVAGRWALLGADQYDVAFGHVPRPHQSHGRLIDPRVSIMHVLKNDKDMPCKYELSSIKVPSTLFIWS